MAELKGGDHPITAELHRSGVGLRINVRCHPIIEEFMQGCQNLQQPQIDPVEQFARNWEPAKGDSRKELLVYGIPKELTGVFRVGSSVSYRMDRPGSPIFLPLDGISDRLSRTLNLSFLRLVGTSSESGVSFTIAGVYSEETMDDLDRQITEATREIYKQFMKPIKITVSLEVRGDVDDRTRMVEVLPATAAAA